MSSESLETQSRCLLKRTTLARPERVAELIKGGADVNTRQRAFHRTPLHLACYNGYIETARLLIGFGARVNAIDKLGETPLHTACAAGHADILPVLARANANLDAISHEGWTPLHVACEGGRTECVKHMLYLGARVRVRDPRGQAPMDLAENQEHPHIVSLLFSFEKRQAVQRLGELRASPEVTKIGPAL